MLFVKLQRMEVKGKLWQAVRATYSHPSVAVRIGNAYSAEESYSSSIRQGSVLSPILFAVFVNDLITELKSITKPESTDAPIRMFMDDLITQCADVETLQRAHDVVTQWCYDWDAVINHSKFEVMTRGLMPEVKSFTEPLNQRMRTGKTCTRILPHSRAK